MAKAAVPDYLGQEFPEASPGLRFGMLLPVWNQDWERNVEDARAAWKTIAELLSADKSRMEALAKRQQATAAMATGLLRLDARTIAPFTTGLGNEHPLENGFAFLSPYGLPYLPGSGVKGVLRQAARELASGEWGGNLGWSMRPDDQPDQGQRGRQRPLDLSVIDVLFGVESGDNNTDHVRGVLSFWDVIPQIRGNRLMVEIMTPHQSHYYQQRNSSLTSPHDSGSPNPISFLTVPPGSAFTFFVACDRPRLARLAPELDAAGTTGNPRWQELVTAAFEHAFEWLGFGAKTAVGYGAMLRDEAAERQAGEKLRESAAAAERERRLKDMTPQQRQVEQFIAYAQKELQKVPRQKGPVGGQDYQRAQALAKAAADWSAADRAEVARVIEEYLPQLVAIDLKALVRKPWFKALKGEQ